MQNIVSGVHGSWEEVAPCDSLPLEGREGFLRHA